MVRASSAPTDLSALRRAYLGGEYAAAESLGALALAGLSGDAAPDSLALAEASFIYGDALDKQGKALDRVLQAIERAFLIRSRHLPPGDLETARAEMRYAECLGADPASGIRHARRALDALLARTDASDTLVATAWMDVGQFQTMLGKNEEGAAALETCLTMRLRIFGPLSDEVAAVRASLGEAYQALGDVEGARREEEEALLILGRIHGTDDLSRAGPISRLLPIEVYLGDLERAVELAAEGVRLCEASGDTAETIISTSNLAALLLEFQDYDGACRASARAVALSDRYRFPNPWVLGTLHQVYGNAAISLGDTALAMREFRAGEAALIAHPAPRGEATLALCVLGQSDVWFKERRYAEARRACERGTALNDHASRPDLPARVSSRSRLIRILEMEGDAAGMAAARGELRRLKEGPGPYIPAVEPSVLFWLARADHDLGNDAAAWDGALEAESAARRHMRFNLDRLPDTRALEMARVKSYILGQVLELARGGDPARRTVAWDRMIRNRGLVGAELAHRRVPASLAGDPEIGRRHDAWVEAQAALARGMVRGAADRGDSTYRAVLDRLHLDAERAEAAYAAALRARGEDTTRVEIGLADVVAALHPEQALVGFAECEGYDGVDRVFGFVARGDRAGVALVDLGSSAALDSLITPWKDRLGESPGSGSDGRRAERECREYGDAVRRAVWDRIAGSIAGATEVDLVGDGPLLDLPWPALPVGEGEYLVEHGPEIRVLDAERDLLDSPAGGAGGRLLAMGDPAFALVDASQPAGGPLLAGIREIEAPCASGLPRVFPRLPGTGEEARAVARVWERGPDQDAALLLGDQATEAAFKARAPGSAILHLATHGVVTGDGCREDGPGTRGVGGLAPIDDHAGAASVPSETPAAPAMRPSSPWEGRRVWLALAGAEHAGAASPGVDDGLLTAEEIVPLDLRGTEWVVLSACHSGLSRSWGREGAVGMRRAFRLAGARSVIAGRWAVEDAAAAEWMRALYEARGEGATRASEAARAASRAVLAERRRSGRSTHPFYWAAFSTDGD